MGDGTHAKAWCPLCPLELCSPHTPGGIAACPPPGPAPTPALEFSHIPPLLTLRGTPPHLPALARRCQLPGLIWASPAPPEEVGVS